MVFCLAIFLKERRSLSKNWFLDSISGIAQGVLSKHRFLESISGIAQGVLSKNKLEPLLTTRWSIPENVKKNTKG